MVHLTMENLSAVERNKKCLAVGVPCKESVESHKIDEIDNITWCYQSVEELYPYGYEHLKQVEAVLNPFSDKAGKVHYNKWVDNGMMNCEMSFYQDSCKATCWDIERKDMQASEERRWPNIYWKCHLARIISISSGVSSNGRWADYRNGYIKVPDCANHFIVVSTQNYFAWSATNEPIQSNSVGIVNLSILLGKR